MRRGGRYEKQRGTRAALKIGGGETKAAAEEISIDAAVAATGRRFRIERGEEETALEAFSLWTSFLFNPDFVWQELHLTPPQWRAYG